MRMGYFNFHTSGTLCEISQRCSPLGPPFPVEFYFLFAWGGGGAGDCRLLALATPLRLPLDFKSSYRFCSAQLGYNAPISVYLWFVCVVTVFFKNNRPPCRNSGSVQALFYVRLIIWVFC